MSYKTYIWQIYDIYMTDIWQIYDRYMTYIWHKSIWSILVFKGPSGPQQSHPFIRFWPTNWIKLKKRKYVSEIFSLYKFLKSFVFSAIFKFHFDVPKWPRIKKVVLRNVLKIEFYFQKNVSQNSRCRFSFSPSPSGSGWWLGLGEILEKMKICTWNSGSHFFGSKIQF